ncbi:MAG TPA: carboxylating nicotinate-nucleotide diphosphorylase [Steroidobacteraceae bacterium]|jgi:nicotinate-nucleotide pyrophosphorylase (carboxylating)|nr:carboxylating nicotinate-nucleotide diphosphorylase [Steroidobacteraceae bacterium]
MNALPADFPSLLPADLDEQVADALREDVAGGDVTASLVPARQRVRGRLITREPMTLCGSAWVEAAFRHLDPHIVLKWQVEEGGQAATDETLLLLEGLARPILTGERTALNFLQLLSGTASEARRYVDAVAGTGCTILDTRKTLPGLRTAQKYAVRCGGAHNHRMGLFDMVLIKENHIAAAGSITRAIETARRVAPRLQVEAEVENLQQLEEALRARPDIVMLDNFTLADLRTAVERNREVGSAVKLEASGNASLETVRAIAETGVDFISVGAITKHVRAIDLSMRLEFTPSAAAEG